jgi:hypothetical protein
MLNYNSIPLLVDVGKQFRLKVKNKNMFDNRR